MSSERPPPDAPARATIAPAGAKQVYASSVVRSTDLRVVLRKTESAL